MSDNQVANFAVLTLNIQTIEVKQPQQGESYAVAQAVLPMGEGRPEMPFRLIITNRLVKVLKPGKTFTLLGQLGYEEQDGQPVYLFFPYKFEGAERPRNFAQLTVRAGQDAEGRYTAAGNFWSRVRAAFGQGKDPEGNWRPSLWLNAKAFTRNGDERLPAVLNALSKGDLFKVSGRLAYEVYEGRPNLDLIATNVAACETPVDAGELAGEPG
jgi:hypothetical protein